MVLTRVLAVALVVAQAGAEVPLTLAPLFADHAVLQRDEPVPIWGGASPGEEITVSFAGQSRNATAGADGRWSVALAPLAASATGSDLTVSVRPPSDRGPGSAVTLHDILVGEVWLCSGQSNMEFTLAEARDAKREIAAATNPLIREIKVKHKVSTVPLETAATTGWRSSTPQVAGTFTAVGYFFAREIAAKLQVPVGIVDSSWGGTPVEAWMDGAALASDPKFAVVNERWQQTMAEYSANKIIYAQAKAAQAKAEAAAVAEGPEAHARWLKDNARLRDPSDPTHWLSFGVASLRSPVPRGPGDSATPTGLFNGMINPLIPEAVRGILWYQGEKNAERAEEYHALFSAMITAWRARFGQPELPFYWVNLANLAFVDDTHRQWAFLRGAQTETLSLPATGQAIAIDLGEDNNIHFGNKQDIGHRLALLAENRLYHLSCEDTGPTFTSVRPEGAALRITFEHARGLAVKGDSINSLELAGADRVFHPGTGRIDGTSLVVESAAVPRPLAIRYAWLNAPQANLYNAAGLPAVPFRSDDW